MKWSPGIKVALLIIGVLACFFSGMAFLKGSGIFGKSRKLIIHFDRTGSLSVGNQVKINGLAVGEVYRLDVATQPGDRPAVTIKINRDFLIPSDSFAEIHEEWGGIGSTCIHIQKGNAATSLSDGDLLKGGPLIEKTPLDNPAARKAVEALLTTLLEQLREKNTTDTAAASRQE